MKTIAVSAKGQVSIPEEMRTALNIHKGDMLSVVVENGKIVLEPIGSIPNSQAWFWTKEVQERIKEAEENYRNGESMTFNNANELIAFLNARDSVS